jgi:hypothetical protein
VLALSILSELDLEDDGDANAESSPDLLLICSALLSKNDLNSFGANSGCRRAGTQKSREASSSLECDEGALGMPAALSCGRSGSSVAPTLIDMRLRACRLLSSCATAAGLDS